MAGACLNSCLPCSASERREASPQFLLEFAICIRFVGVFYSDGTYDMILLPVCLCVVLCAQEIRTAEEGASFLADEYQSILDQAEVLEAAQTNAPRELAFLRGILKRRKTTRKRKRREKKEKKHRLIFDHVCV